MFTKINKVILQFYFLTEIKNNNKTRSSASNCHGQRFINSIVIKCITHCKPHSLSSYI